MKSYFQTTHGNLFAEETWSVGRSWFDFWLDCHDRHPQIQKFLREHNIIHFYDFWHIEKGMLPDALYKTL